MNKPYKAVLFDLDGTLLDTAADLCFALNQLRLKENLAEIPLESIRPIAGQGVRALLKQGFGISENDPLYRPLHTAFLEFYQLHLTRSTQLFPGMNEVLTYLNQAAIPWGIVTNKLTRFTLPILKKLKLDEASHCIICGDTLSHFKPHPAPILRACELIGCTPHECLYIGDTLIDVKASKAAGTTAVVALYGYQASDDEPQKWMADAYIKHPTDILAWL